METVKEKDRQREVLELELKEQRNHCERLDKVIKEIEQVNIKLKGENDEAKNDLRKLMRT